MVRFRNRREAGKRLGALLDRYRDRDVVVLGLPRGGVPVAYEVARALKAPLDVFIVRKLGVPGHEELAMGAIASGGVRADNPEIVRGLGIPEGAIERVVERERRELERREVAYRGEGTPRPDVGGKVAILVDDGLATGASMRAAIKALRRLEPAEIVVAVPTASPDICRQIAESVDDMICAQTPEPFMGVGAWYQDFRQTTDDEVTRLLADARTTIDS